jgi:hypothetical protein
MAPVTGSSIDQSSYNGSHSPEETQRFYGSVDQQDTGKRFLVLE